MAIKLTSEQQAVVDSRGGELLVSAAAGSGKTRVLVERLVDRVEQEDLDLTQFLVITFTKAAASELRSKILSELNRRLSENGENRRLRRQLGLVHLAQISTIHAFCTAFLRENCHLLGLDSDFRVADTQESELLRAQTLDRLLEQRYEGMEQGGFAALLDAFSAGRDDRKLVEMTLSIHRRIQAHPDPRRWLREQSAAFRWQEGTDAGETEWGKLLRSDAAGKVRYWIGKLEEAIDYSLMDDALSTSYGPVLEGDRDRLRAALTALEQGGWDEARERLSAPFPRLTGSKKVVNKSAQGRAKAIRDECKKAMGKLSDRFQCSSAQLMADLSAVAPAVEELFALILALEEAFQQAKTARKLVDFNDLEHRTLAALVQDGAPTELALRWRERYAEVMVDEYQDTNAVQNAIFDALTDNGKTLFQVGDVKQSIYRFRLADPTIFLRKYHSFVPGAEAKEGQPRLLVLSRNFRSQKAVLDAVNFVFSAIMTRPFGEIDYTGDQRLYCGRADGETGGGVELDVVDLSTLERSQEEEDIPRDQAEARFVARRVRKLLESGLTVPQGEGERPLRPEDIAILYRSPAAVLPYLTAALDEEGVSWQNEGTVDLLQTTEVSVALSFLEVIDNPRQDVSLLSVLRCPVYAFSPDLLSRLRVQSPDTDLYGCVVQGARDGEEHCVRFLRELEELRLLMNDYSCAQMLWHLYEHRGLLGLFGAMTGGERRQENLLSFYDFARCFEQQGHRGLFAFVHQLRRMAEQGDEVKGSRTAGAGGVQITSIHRSKGLEYPVVVLGGLNRAFNKMDEREPMLFHPRLGVGPKLLDPELRMEVPTLARTAVQLQLERERRAEELRLLYVAMTRARERLIMVMTLRDAPKELNSLLEQASPKPEPELLAAQPSVARWMLLPILCRADAGELWRENRPDTVMDPPDHWDIRLVSAEAEPEGSGEAEERETAPAGSAVPDEALLTALNWCYPGEGLALLPSKVTATQLKGRTLDEEAAENTRRAAPPLEFRRPDFARRSGALTAAQAGSAVHAVMERIDPALGADPVRVTGEIERLRSEGHLTAEQAAAVRPEQVARFWSSPLGRAAAQSPALRREFKFSVLAPASRFYPGTPAEERVLVQGVVDCCFEDASGLTVVDFKSDRVQPGGEPEAAERYRAQVEVYADALEEIFGKPVTRRVVWFLRTGCGTEMKSEE